MRKTSRIGAAAVGALAIALIGALAATPASGAGAAAKHKPLPLSSIRPSSPLKAIGARPDAATLQASSITSLQSANWAGYAASLGTTTFRFAAAHFNAPQLNCLGVTAPSGALSAHWVGLDGFRATSTTVEQVGLLAACNGSTPEYIPFWEMFPLAARFPAITVHPGDAISLSVFFNKATRQFTVSFADTTDGQGFTHTRGCPAGATCLRNSAEAISESPFDPTTSTFLPLADFQAAAFADVTITNTSGTHRGGLRSPFWNTFRITQVAAQDASGHPLNFTITGAPITPGTILDTPTPLYKGATFLNYWMQANAG